MLAVLIGGLAIYLGYQLFMKMPQRKEDSEGRAELPGGISIYVSRVGPGVFFALFGAAILGFSFSSPLQLNPGETQKQEREARVSYLSDGKEIPVSDEERQQVLRDLQRVIGLERSLETGAAGMTPEQINGLLISLQRIKRQMLRSVWDADAWGDYPTFRQWLERGDPANPPAQASAAAKLFHGAP